MIVLADSRAPAGAPRSTQWKNGRWLETHLAIMRAARGLREDGQAVTNSALAVRTGVDRQTIRRHFPNPAGALQLMSTPEQFEALLAAVERRPAGEPAMCMAVHAFYDAVCQLAADPEALSVLREKADQLAATPEGPAMIHNDFVQRWQQPLTETLARRHDRPAPGGEELSAAYQVFTLCPSTLQTWQMEGYARSVEAVAADLLHWNGHKTFGVCPVAEAQRRI